MAVTELHLWWKLSSALLDVAQKTKSRFSGLEKIMWLKGHDIVYWSLLKYVD